MQMVVSQDVNKEQNPKEVQSQGKAENIKLSWSAAGLHIHEGSVGDRTVKVLRNTGCSGGVVRESLVKDEERPGESRKCTLIDGTVREFETARLGVHTPFFSGQLEALVMPNPLCDLIIGNVPGARGLDDPDPSFRRRRQQKRGVRRRAWLRV